MPAKAQRDLIDDTLEKVIDKKPDKKTWKMKHQETGKIAEVHPDERVNYFKGGYVPVKE